MKFLKKTSIKIVQRSRPLNCSRVALVAAIMLGVALVFSFWLMWHTFDYRDNTIYIATKVWSDFAANIPLIRSFSWGKNFPPEYPLFPGEPIKYHFLFYLMVGLLEKVGLPLDWALNLPSAFGFASLLIIIYLLAKLLFNKKGVAFLAVVFFLFNGSLSFLEFFRQHPLSLNTPREILTNQTFPSFGPYDGKIVSAFWNLNIFTNQRHLAPAYAFVLLLIFFLIQSKLPKLAPNGAILRNTKGVCWQTLLLGIGLGLMPFFHKAVFAMAVMVLSSLFLLVPKLRRPAFLILAISGLLALPQVLYQTGGGGPPFSFNPGYLVPKPLTAYKFAHYWFLNLGLSTILIPLGLLWTNNRNRKVFLSFFTLFVIGNLFQFSPEIAANHKFFNLFLIIGNMFSAWAIYQLWQKSILTRLLIPFLIVLLTLSGIIDFFPIKNDVYVKIEDAPKNQDVLWIKENTPPDAVFLNSSYLYHPANLAGRKIFFGWPYFSWSAGYDTSERRKERDRVLGASTLNKDFVCKVLVANNIQFVSLEKNEPENVTIDLSFWEDNFTEVYKNSETGFRVFFVDQNCD